MYRYMQQWKRVLSYSGCSMDLPCCICVEVSQPTKLFCFQVAGIASVMPRWCYSASSYIKCGMMADHDRPLSKRGRLAAANIASKLEQHSWLPGLILCRLSCCYAIQIVLLTRITFEYPLSQGFKLYDILISGIYLNEIMRTPSLIVDLDMLISLAFKVSIINLLPVDLSSLICFDSPF